MNSFSHIVQSALASSFCRLWWSIRHCSWFKNPPRSSCLSSTTTSSLAFELYFNVPKCEISTWWTTKWSAGFCNCHYHVYGVCHANDLPQPGQSSSLSLYLLFQNFCADSVCLFIYFFWSTFNVPLKLGKQLSIIVHYICCSLCFFYLFSMRTRAGLVTLIYAKSLVLANDENSRASGDIVNLMSVDATRLQEFCTYGLMAISGPLQVKKKFVL